MTNFEKVRQEIDPRGHWTIESPVVGALGKEVKETMTKIVKSKKTVATRAGNLITGMKAKFTNGSDKLTFGGGAFVVTVDDAIANLQAIVDNRAAVTAAKAAAKAKVADENAKLPPLLAFMRALVAFIKQTFGADATALALFDIEPAKARTPMTAEEKAVAVARRDATRKARGTTGPKEKKKVHGSVQATLVVTAGAPAEPANAAPEPSAPPAPAAATAPATPPKG